MTDSVWRFLIKGKDETEVHGIMLRRKIKQMADKEKLCGSVKNIKHKPEIEIKIASNKEDSEKFRESTEKALNEKVKAKDEEEKYNFTQLFCIEGEKAEDYKEFAVIREDELTEMVWALQGAGDVFVKSAEIAKKSAETADKILETIINRDIKKEFSRLSALSIEIKAVLNQIENITKNAERNELTLFSFRNLSLKETLINPIFLDKDFMQTTPEVYNILEYLQSKEFLGLAPEFKLKALEKYKKIIDEYVNIISGRLEQLNI